MFGGITTSPNAWKWITNGSGNRFLFLSIWTIVISLTAGAYADTIANGPELKRTVIRFVEYIAFMTTFMYDALMKIATAKLLMTPKVRPTPSPTKLENSKIFPQMI